MHHNVPGYAPFRSLFCATGGAFFLCEPDVSSWRVTATSGWRLRDGEQNKPGTGMFPGLISGQFREKVKGGEEYGMGYTRCCG